MKSLYLDISHAYVLSTTNYKYTIRRSLFFRNIENELTFLQDDIINRVYQIKKVNAYIIGKNKKSEVFAVYFRDRVIEYLLYSYLKPTLNSDLSNFSEEKQAFDPSFIFDLVDDCSDSMTEDCFVLDFRIKSYYRNINRNLLYRKVNELLLSERLKSPVEGIEKLQKKETTDFLVRKFTLFDPVENSSNKLDFKTKKLIPKSESFFFAKKGHGIISTGPLAPVFGYVYLADFDKKIRDVFNLKYYYRDTNRILIVHPDKKVLWHIAFWSKQYLSKHYHLSFDLKQSNMQYYFRKKLSARTFLTAGWINQLFLYFSKQNKIK